MTVFRNKQERAKFIETPQGVAVKMRQSTFATSDKVVGYRNKMEREKFTDSNEVRYVVEG